MSRENLDLALLMYEVFNRRDLDTMLALAHDEVEIGSASLYGGGSHRHEGMRADRTTPRCPLQLRRSRSETDDRRPGQTHLGIGALGPVSSARA